MNPAQPQTPPQKLVDFNEELKALCAKYQYELSAVGQLIVNDVSPKVTGVPLQSEAPVEVPIVEPTPETPVETPVLPESSPVEPVVYN